MKKKCILFYIVAIFLILPIISCSHDSSGGSDEGSESYEGKGSQSKPSYSSSPSLEIWTSGSGETFTFYEDGTYSYEKDGKEIRGTYEKDEKGNFILTGEDGSSFYFEINDDGTATVYEIENGEKKEGTTFKKIDPYRCTVAEAAKYISTLTEDKTYTVIVFDEEETSCSALINALSGLSSTESVGPYVSLDLTGAIVLSISANAFDAGESEVEYALKDIILPKITSIGNYAFRNQAGLENIEIPSTLDTLGTNAFSGCSSLTSIDLSETSVTNLPGSNAMSSGWGMFYNCTSLSKVSLPSCLKTIGHSAFACCSSLDSIDLSRIGVTTINDYAFASCTSLTSIILPETLKTIGKRIFCICTSLVSIDLSNTQITEIPDGSSAFISSYGYYGMFGKCTSLESVILPTDLTTLGEHTFDGCSALKKNIDLSKMTKLTSIGDDAFQYCSSLTSVGDKLPASLKTIGKYAFNECKSLTSIDLSSTQVTEIGNYTFAYCSALTSIKLPTNLETIGVLAFYSCSSLKSIDLPSSLKTIEDAFRSCSSLTSIDLSNTQVTEIGDYAFLSCSALTSIDLSSTQITEIGNYAFYYCSALTSIDLSSTQITEIGNYTFAYCSALASIKLPTNLETIDKYAFYQCESLTSIDLSETQVVEIGVYAFYKCESLQTIKINKTDGYVWGHPSTQKETDPYPSSSDLNLVEDFEEYATYYLSGNSPTGSVDINGYLYYWYKVSKS